MKQEVSVVIPAYNSARFVSEAIDSALSQSFKPLEVIVVDDGSRDGTRSVIERYGDKVRYIYQSNAGPAAARNKGVREAKSEWIAFLDSDDYWDIRHLEMLLKHARDHPDASLIYCGKKWVDKDGKLIQNSFEQTQFPSGWIFKDLFTANYISSTSVVLVKRAIFIKLGGFDEQLRIAEDYDLWLRISAIEQIRGVPIYSVNYRRHDSNLTLQAIGRFKGVLAALENAQGMMRQKLVDKRNNPESIDVYIRMKQFYDDVAIGLFYLGEYKELRSLGEDAIRNCYITKSLLIRWILSWIPQRVLTYLREIYRKNK